MTQSTTLYVGMDVHQESLRSPISPRDHDAQGHLPRHHWHATSRHRSNHPQLQSKAKHLVFVSEAGPCGYWLYRLSDAKKDTFAGSSPPR